MTTAFFYLQLAKDAIPPEPTEQIVVTLIIKIYIYVLAYVSGSSKIQILMIFIELRANQGGCG